MKIIVDQTVKSGVGDDSVIYVPTEVEVIDISDEEGTSTTTGV